MNRRKFPEEYPLGEWVAAKESCGFKWFLERRVKADPSKYLKGHCPEYIGFGENGDEFTEARARFMAAALMAKGPWPKNDE